MLQAERHKINSLPHLTTYFFFLQLKCLFIYLFNHDIPVRVRIIFVLSSFRIKKLFLRPVVVRSFQVAGSQNVLTVTSDDLDGENLW